MAIIGEKSAPGIPPRKRKGPELVAGDVLPALSWDEIAAELHISHQACHQYYRSGLRKLQRFHPERLARLRLLAAELAAAREMRLRGAVAVPHVRTAS